MYIHIYIHVLFLLSVNKISLGPIQYNTMQLNNSNTVLLKGIFLNCKLGLLANEKR